MKTKLLILLFLMCFVGSGCERKVICKHIINSKTGKCIHCGKHYTETPLNEPHWGIVFDDEVNERHR